jgi:hypothetical protein
MEVRRDRPFFLGGIGPIAELKVLLERDGCQITRRGTNVELTLWKGAWTDKHTDLARRYDVNQVSVPDPAFGDKRTADFLLDLPSLRRLTLSFWSPVDLSSLGRLHDLRSLHMTNFGIGGWRLGDRLEAVDLSGMTKLETAHIMMCKAFESILKCRKIKELTVCNDCDGRLRDLDLSDLPALRDLALDHCPKLRKVTLHAKAKVRALRLALCGSYKIDWRRMGPDLRYLVLGGRLTFALEDVLNAPDLEELHTHEIRKLPPLGFLRKLEKLRVVFAFAAPPGPKFSDDDLAVLREYRPR